MKPKDAKKTRRNQELYPGLKKKFTTRIRREYHDMDYLHLLNKEELEFLNKYIEEELNTSFKNDGTDFNQTQEERKLIYDRNNSSNRCLYGNLKNNTFNNQKLVNYDNVVSEVEDSGNRELNPKHLEDAYVDFIEFKEIEAMLQEYDDAMSSFSEISEPLQE